MKTTIENYGIACTVHCMGWPQGKFVPVENCAQAARNACKDENEEGAIDICHC